jgi:hypothetical protein
MARTGPASGQTTIINFNWVLYIYIYKTPRGLKSEALYASYKVILFH